MNQEKHCCDLCKYSNVVIVESKKKCYCWYYKKPVEYTDICKIFDYSPFEERMIINDKFGNTSGLYWANKKRDKEKEFRNLIIRIIEIGLLAILVSVTIIFGFQ